MDSCLRFKCCRSNAESRDREKGKGQYSHQSAEGASLLSISVRGRVLATATGMARYIGAHTIDNGGLHMAVLRAGKAGMTAMQCFTAIPRFYGDKATIKPERGAPLQGAPAQNKNKGGNAGRAAGVLAEGSTPRARQ